MINVIYNDFQYELSERKKEVWDKYNKLIQWGRQHPLRFAETVLGLEFTDHQKYIFMSTWIAENIVWLMGRSSGKSFLTAPYIMTRSLLIPNHQTYILSLTGQQSQETFGKIEDLALGNIASITNSSQVFLMEILKKNSKDSGFVHDKNSHHFQLYNGSEVNTLNGLPKNLVGMRSQLNVYDEAGKIPREMFDLTKPFTAQNTDFITGKNLNSKCYPRQFPPQILYCSSAEDIFTELWDAYVLGAKQMLMGNTDYFVCDIDARFSLYPKMNGENYTPLVKQSTIDDAMAKNSYRATREYYNRFDVTGGQNSLVGKGKILENTQAYMPVFEWEKGKRYIIINDPSSKLDNSFILVAELFKDEKKGWMCKLVNGHNLIEVSPGGNKKLIQKPEQIEILKEYIVKYNGPSNDYDNLEQIIIDAGAGGGGFDIAQFLMPGFVYKNEHHIGIIDLEDKYCHEMKSKFPEAKSILTLANFKRDKVAMYEAAYDALNQGLIIFPKDATGRNEMEFEDKQPDGTVLYRNEKLSSEQLRAVTELELLKYELMAMEKTKSSNGNIKYDLAVDKVSGGVHDDRADCVAMLSFYLMKLRAKDKMKQYDKPEVDFSQLLANRQQVSQGKFGSGNNPFVNRGHNPFL